MEARYLTPKKAAEVFGLSAKTLANLRSQRKGPRFVKLRKKVLYPVDELERWLKENGVLVETQN